MKSAFKFSLLLIVIISNRFLSEAQVSGIVFRDYNGNGTRQNAAGYAEPGAGGVIIRAYNANDVLIATQTSSSANATLGQYSFPASGINSIPNGTAVRLEFIIPSGACTVNSAYDFSSGAGATYGTAVRFVTGGAATVNINYAINSPADYLSAVSPFASVTMFTPIQFTGNPTGGGTSGTSIAFYKFPYTNEGSTSPTGTPPPNATDLATNAQIGTCYGVAYSKFASRIFTSAFMKRHAGFGPANGIFNNAPGAIYIINPSLTSSTGAASYFASLDALGYPTHNSTGAPAYGPVTSYNIAGTGIGAVLSFTTNGLGVVGTNLDRGLPADKATRHRDPAAFDQVGKVSLGDMDISDDGQYLFITNLYDRKIYQLQLNNVKNPTSAIVIGSWSLPNPPLRSTSGLLNASSTYTGANNGTNFYDGTRGLQRPFALKYHRGKLYIGAVTTGEGTGAVSTQEINNNGVPEYTDLWAYVWEFDPAAGSFTASPILQTPLNFNRGTNADAQSETWRPWTNTFPTPWSAASPRYTQHQQPIFTDIAFDTDGTMILGFRDRFGDQSAFDEETLNNNTRIAGQAMGDIYRAYFNTSTCVFEMEQNGLEGPGSSKAATAGVNNANGPGNYSTNSGEFYFRDGVYNGNTSTAVGTFHLNCTQGALSIIKGTDTVATTTMDPIRAWSGGVSWYSNTTGDNGRDYEMVAGTGAGNFPVNAIGDIGKANGLGDLELLQDVAPTEIGNRVWNDINGDGIQEAGETGIGNVTLQLYSNGVDGIPGNGDDVQLGTTTTATVGDIGSWYFNTSNVTDGDPLTAGNQAGPQPGIPYNIRIGAADWSGGTGSGDLAGYQLTQTDKTGTGAADLSDNDAALNSNAFPMISLTIAAAGQNNHDLDFGFKQLASLGDKVWRDDDKDGIQDIGEPGVAGVTVTLYNNAGVVAGTTVTDAYGMYLFDNLTPATYQVSFTPPANYTFTTQTNNTDNTTLTGGSTAANGSDVSTATGRTANVVLASGENERNIDAGLIFGQPATASVGDKVWLDTDGDGVQDANEVGVSGVTATLYNNLGVAIATTVTDANGNYLFTGLSAGTFSVGFTLPVGMTFTGKDQGGNDDTDSDANTSGVNFGRTDNFTLANGENKTNVDAGLVQTGPTTASLGDKVWLDLPGGTANVQDAGETGITGVTVNLYRDANGDGIINGAEAATPYATTVTDGFGNYIFNNLPAAAGSTLYKVGFVAPGGYTLVTANVGADETKDSDANTGTGLTGNYFLFPGQRNLTVDAGLTQNAPAGTARLGDTVWFDADNDGVQDAGENGVAGVSVALYNSLGVAIATTATDANGNYQFVNLGAGDYSVGFSNLPAGYSFVPIWSSNDANATNSDANPATGRTAIITLSTGESEQDIDAGLIAGVPSGLGSLGNKVWYDLDSDGLQDVGELGVAGVLVTLFDAGADGVVGNGDDGISRTTTTNPLGEYIFTGLPAGNYTVQFGTAGQQLPVGYTVPSANQGANDAIDSDGFPVATNGAPAGSSRTSVYNLATGEDNLTVDLGLTPATGTNTVGNYVWFDNGAGGGSANDGIQNGTEQGVAGVTIKLFRDANNDGVLAGGELTPVAISTTDVNGAYLFTGLPDGSYQLEFSNLPAGFNFTGADVNAENLGTDSDANQGTGKTGFINIDQPGTNPASVVNLNVDGGITSARAALGNYIWLDTDGNGTQIFDGTEPGIAGVTVTLYRPGFGLDGIAGNSDDALPVASMITDQNGQYLFSNLEPGTYEVEFSTVPGSLFFTQRNTPGDNGNNTNSDAVPVSGNPSVARTTGITLIAGETDLTVDAGLFRPRAVIGNFVWSDQNNNGVQDAGEPGIGGVVITLLDGGGNPVSVVITDANGFYLFPNVAPGSYSLSFTNLPAGVTFTTPNQTGSGGNDTNDSDVIGTSITGIVVTTTTTNLSFDAGVIGAITLPARLEFFAIRQGSTAKLSWKVTQEDNVARYELERSADGSSYTSINSQSRSGSNLYQHTDVQPVTGINYYRVRVIDNDGRYNFSEVRILLFSKSGQVLIFPNPAVDIVNIQLPDNWQQTKVKLEMYTQSGQLVISKQQQQSNQIEKLNVGNLPRGIYTLRLQTVSGEVEVRKVQLVN
ncbi:MAG: T9SS type A sorting domain-containing protein [Chitinophagaceae bacterium]|nr:T9SS type A sorting domain-containing protein [Chitinophagaceae bacterium]